MSETNGHLLGGDNTAENWCSGQGGAEGLIAREGIHRPGGEEGVRCSSFTYLGLFNPDSVGFTAEVPGGCLAS